MKPLTNVLENVRDFPHHNVSRGVFNSTIDIYRTVSMAIESPSCQKIDPVFNILRRRMEGLAFAMKEDRVVFEAIEKSNETH